MLELIVRRIERFYGSLAKIELCKGPRPIRTRSARRQNSSRNHATPAARKSERRPRLPHPCLPHGRRSFFPACCACAFVVLLLPYFGRPYGGGAMEVVSIITYRRIPPLHASGLDWTYCKWSGAMRNWCLQLVAIHVSTVRLAYHTLNQQRDPN